MNVPASLRIVASLASFAALAAVGAGCGKSESPTAAVGPGAAQPAANAASPGTAPSAPADATYDARGVITALIPASESGPARLSIHHERIPNFKDREGKVVGMDSMTMTFDITPDVKFDSLHVNDKVAFRCEVHWTGSPLVVVSKVEPLPTGTALTLSAAHGAH